MSCYNIFLILPWKIFLRKQFIIAVPALIKRKHIVRHRCLRIIIRLCPSILRIPDIGMFHQVVFSIHDGTLPTDEQDGIPVIQHPYLVRCQKFSATLSSGEFRNTSEHYKNIAKFGFIMYTESGN